MIQCLYCASLLDFGRIPKEITDAVLITTMMLPGTTIIYYGDEIGMATTTDISFEDTKDPYALPPYASETDYKKKSRDPFRTPMHVSLFVCLFVCLFLHTTKIEFKIYKNGPFLT